MRNPVEQYRRPSSWLSFVTSLVLLATLMISPLMQVASAQRVVNTQGRPDRGRVTPPPPGGGVDEGVAQDKDSSFQADRPSTPETSVIQLTPDQAKEQRAGKAGDPLVPPTPAPPQNYVEEVEPNNTTAEANPLPGTNSTVRGNIQPNGDVDRFSFSATTGDRVFSALMTSASSSASTDSQLRLFLPDGTTVLEFDEDDGSLGTLSSTLANVAIPSAGTYILEVRHFSATNTLRPYELHFRLQSGSPTPEVEPNDTAGTANPLPLNGYVSGARNPAVATEQDWYSMNLAAGDTVYLGLDLDPERDNVQWNGRLGIALFGDADNQILVVDDASVGSPTNPLSEAMFMTVKTAGTYYAFVDSATAATGGPTATYTLSVSVQSQRDEGINCTTYTSTDVPQTIGPGAGLVSSTITVPGNPRIADVDVSIVLNHALMADIDANLRSPANNNNALFNDIGSTATGGQTQMDVTFDDEAAIPPTFTALRPVKLRPELNYRLDWFDGENAGGVWTLDLRDDLTNTSGGTLTSWSLRICEQPPVTGSVTLFNTDFESDDAGFTHTGTADEWERGTPATVATTTTNPVAEFSTCNSGTNCWKTDLDGTYEISSNQDLLSPPIALTAGAPITLTWAQRYQMESATFDHYTVSVYEVGNQVATERILYQWGGATMTVAPGSPVTNIGESAGWGVYNADISSFAGRTVQVRFHVDTDTSINFAGVAIDDVRVTAAPLTPVAAGDLIISEFRLRGTGGANDEFVEIYNATASPITVNATDGSAGFALVASDGTARFVIPNGTVIPARGHYLGVNSVGYSLGSYASGDISFTTDIPDNAGIALFNTATAANFVLANRLDAVGPTSVASTLYREGNGYPPLTPFSIDYSFVRDNCGKQGSIATFGACPSGGLPVDTNDNGPDFYFVDTNGTSAGAGQRLGAPGPENLASPIQRNSMVAVPELDSTVSASSPPNRVRDFTSDPANNSTFGTLDLRKRVINNTGAAITRLRFRIVDITTFPAPSGIADLRPRTSTPIVVTVGDAATCAPLAAPCMVTVQGTTLEQPPSQPNGGGFNSTLSAGTVTLGTPIASGQSINVHFLLGIQQTGRFKFLVNVEVLP